MIDRAGALYRRQGVAKVVRTKQICLADLALVERISCIMVEAVEQDMEQSTYYIFASIAAISAAGAFVFSVVKGRQDIQRSREVSARAAWEAYLEMAFENPDLARAAVEKADADKFEKYEWFVSRMLYAAEEVLTLSAQSKPWAAAIKCQMSFHSAYLRDQGSQYMDHYSNELQEIYRQQFGADV